MSPPQVRQQVVMPDVPTLWEQEIVKLAADEGGRAGARVFGQLEQMARLRADAPPPAQPASPPPAPGWAGVKRRAAEHLVMDGAGAATPNGTWPAAPTWALDLASEWTAAAMPIAAATSVVELAGTANGIPAVPQVTDAPTAGAQAGEKTDAYSRAFTVGPATTTAIDSTLVLNWSAQLEATSAGAIGWAMSAAAVAAEADRQLGAVIVAEGTPAADLSAAFGAFAGGRFLPSALLLPPGDLATLGSYTVADLAALGVRVVLAHVAQAVLLAPGAVTGWLLPVEQTAVEPALLGTARGWAIFGAVAVDPAGAAVVA